MSKEIWKDIKGFEGMYQVSNLGRVKSLERTVKFTNYHPKVGNYETSNTYKERILRFHTTKEGYKRCFLSKDGYGKHYRVHRLVAEAFIPNPDNKPEVNHIDEDKANNSVENLEWVTRIENIRHGTRVERCTEHKKKKVLCITTNETFDSIKEAATAYNLDQSTVGKVCNGRAKSTKGMKFKFI